MGLEVLRSKVQKMTQGQTQIRKEQTVKDHFARWSHAGLLSLPQFRMAVSELGVPARAAEDIFQELDNTRRGQIEIRKVITSVIPERDIPEHPLHHVVRRPTLQDSRSSSAADLSRVKEQQPAQAPSAPSSPSGHLSRCPEDLKEKKIRGFWDLIGNRALEKNFKSVADLLQAMDKDVSGYLDRNEVRRFFKVVLCLAVTKADEFFKLVDESKSGKVACREMSRCLAPYLDKNYRPEADEVVAQEAAARAERDREKELKGYWELIGTRAYDKGFRSVGQLMLQMDKDDNGQLDRKEMRTFLTQYVHFSQQTADRIFNLLDVTQRGSVSAKEIRKRLEPYFVKVLRDPGHHVADWRSAAAAGTLEGPPDREEELRKYWDLIGTKFFERGYRSSGQVLMTMDKDDSNFLDRDEVRLFFDRHLGYDQSSADHFFDLMDSEGHGNVSCRAIAQCLAPYFHKNLREPAEVARWETPQQDRRGEPPELQQTPGRRPSFGGTSAASAAQAREAAWHEQRGGPLEQRGGPPEPQQTPSRRPSFGGTAGSSAYAQAREMPCQEQRGFPPEPPLTPHGRAGFGGAAASSAYAQETPRPERRGEPGELQQAPAGRASFGGPGGNGTSTPLRRGMMRNASTPGWAPHTARADPRDSFSRDGQGMPGGAAPTAEPPLAPPEGPAGAARSDWRGAEERGADRGLADFAPPRRSRSNDPGARRVPLVGEEAPLPAARSSWSGSMSRGQEAPPLDSPDEGQSFDLSSVVLAEFRRVIVARAGVAGIHQFGRTFRIMDTSRDLKVSLAELDVALRRFGLSLKRKDLTLLMNAVDEDGSGTIGCTEFLRAVRGPVPEKRQRIIDWAFDRLDRDSSGVLEVRDIQNLYDVSRVPDVQKGKLTEEAALQQFLSQFDGIHHDGTVTRQEFAEYYASISASIDDDGHFEQLLRNAWRGSRSWPPAWAGEVPSGRSDNLSASRQRRVTMMPGSDYRH